MNVRELEYLVAIADHQHFGRAAAACGVTQPTLSTQIRKLERELAVELVERGTRRVALTTIGVEIVERARNVLAEVSTINDLATAAADPAASRIHLGLFPTLGPYLLPQVMPNVRRDFPDLELRLVEEKTDDILNQLASGHLDVGILALPIDDERLDYEVLFDEEFYLAVPAGHHLSGTAAVSVDVLAGEDILLLEDGHCLRDHALDVCNLAGAAERQDFRSTSLETMRQMVASGLGVTLLPNLSVHPSTNNHVAVDIVKFVDPAPSRRIVMAWRPTSAFRDFFPQLAEVFRQVSMGAPISDPPH